MNTMVLLMLVSVTGAAVLFIALAVYLHLIIRELHAIGGSATSFLGKIRFGLRAIETETGGLAPHVTKLNTGLTAIRDGLGGIDENLGGLIQAVSQQEGL